MPDDLEIEKFIDHHKIEKISISKDYKGTIENTLKRYLEKDLKSFFLVDLASIKRKLIHWEKTFPKIKLFYALKCNPNPLIISFLADYGAGFDCASRSEIFQVLQNSVPPNRIIFANPLKAREDILFAALNGVNRMTFDGIEELHKIYEVYKSLKIVDKVQLVLRVKVLNSKATLNLNAKYGVPLCKITEILTTVKSLNISLIGASFHVGCCCYDVSAYRKALQNCKFVFDEALRQGLKPLRFLDIGGGFPGGSFGGFSGEEEILEDKLRIEEIGDVVNEEIDAVFGSGLEVIGEPGRFLVESCQTLVAQIIEKKIFRKKSNPQISHIKYFLNQGIYGPLKDALFLDSNFYLNSLQERNNSEILQRFESSFLGPTGLKNDIVVRSIALEELSVESFVYFISVGAYTSSFISKRVRFCETSFLYVWIE